jgi:hypothetical protein
LEIFIGDCITNADLRLRRTRELTPRSLEN